jgi:aminobenzoyl-glutamate transport protein
MSFMLNLKEKKINNSLMSKILSFIEKAGNVLPHPATLFFIFAVLVILLSALFSYLDTEVLHPSTQEIIRPLNLLTLEGLHKIISSMVTNFTGFVPLGTVLVAMLGIGVAEGSGLISSSLKLFISAAPKSLLTAFIVFAGVVSNIASEIGYVLLIPLAAIVFKSVGRNPIIGIAAAFAGVSGGYSANILLGTLDPLLAGLSQEASRIVQADYIVDPTANYYFMLASTFVVTFVVTFVTEKIVVPRLGNEYKPEEQDEENNQSSKNLTDDSIGKISSNEKRGLMFAFITFIIISTIILLGAVPSDGFLRDIQTGSLIRSPLTSGVVAFIFIIASAMGLFYGIGARKIKSDSDFLKGMSQTVGNLGSYIVMVFFAAQFVAYFNWSNLGIILAINGANFLQFLGLGQIPLIIGLVIISALINIIMGSASAKWAVLAPVFVPMFMILGYSPELTQVAYRIGDSTTNIISPMLPYFAFIVCIMQKYKKDTGIGTLVATMLPYTVSLIITWVIFLVIWFLIGLPLGPGAGLTY